MSKVRRITAEGLSYSWTTIPHVTQHDQADITELEKFRKAHLKEVEAAGGKLTITAILVKIAAEGLKRFPQFNTSLDMDTDEIIYKKFYNVGVAVDTDRGLLVPVLKDLDRKSLTEIAVEMTQITQATRDRKVTPERLEGGNFTISNLGGIGGTHFTPIVYPPQVAIIGVSKSELTPVWIDEAFHPRLVLPLSLSYDHRIIDGADGARFMHWFVRALEQPLSLFL
jgi:pyruvate dehydrogenase E2 component (dihydrolipoamide acetyltransferase)